MTNSEIIMTAMVVIAPIVSVIVAIIVARRNKDKDVKKDAEELGLMKADLAYIKSGIDDLKRNDKMKDERMDKFNEAIVRLEERFDSHIRDKNAHNNTRGGKKS